MPGGSGPVRPGSADHRVRQVNRQVCLVQGLDRQNCLLTGYHDRVTDPRVRPSAARDRILDAAFPLFYAHGIRAVGVDRIIADSGVAKATFYKHFPAKEDLVVAYLDRVDGIWGEQLRDAARRAGRGPGSSVRTPEKTPEKGAGRFTGNSERTVKRSPLFIRGITGETDVDFRGQ